MKHQGVGPYLLVGLILLCGCGGRDGTSPPPQFADIAGNWQFTLTSASAGSNPSTLAGSIHQSSGSISGAVHIGGSSCFDALSTVDLTGTLTGSNIQLTSTSVSGQVATITGTTSDSGFTGTFNILGGCADGEHGSITGNKVPFVSGTVNGTFTPASGQGFDVVAQVAEGSASSAGTFGLTGTVTFASGCLSSGTIESGSFPGGSFLLGTSMVLEIGTNNGNLTFEGTVDQFTGEISGNYKISGGSCDHSGTAVLIVSDPWGY